MAERDPRQWMMSEALSALARAEQIHSRFFEIAGGHRSELPCWEPPVDVVETDREILVLVALPGVAPERVEARIEGGELVVRGRRALPAEYRHAVIHRLELPQGRFERRIALPAGNYQIRHRAIDGCLVFSLEKASRGGEP